MVTWVNVLFSKRKHNQGEVEMKTSLIVLSTVAMFGVVASVVNRQAVAQGGGPRVTLENPVVFANDRNPYQHAKGFTWGGFGCESLSNCTVTFPVVPAGKRLVVTHVDGQINISSNSALLNVVLETSSTHTRRSLPAILLSTVTVPAATSHYTVNAEILAYFEPGDVPQIKVRTNLPNVAFSSDVTLSGYFVQL